MEPFVLITFLSDFGWRGGYVGSCAALLASLAPTARLLHISHEVRAGDIHEGALVLSRVAPLGPMAVHLAVVDPGVGTSREPIAVRARRGDFLVGPNNGLLAAAADKLGGLEAAWSLDPARVRTEAGLPVEAVSATFHGRDVFAPAAALLARGVAATRLGESLSDAHFLRLATPRLVLEGDQILAEVIEVDRFGNVALALSSNHLEPSCEHLLVELAGEVQGLRRARRVRTYADLKAGELGFLEDSWDNMSLVLYGESAAASLSVHRGSILRLRLPEDQAGLAEDQAGGDTDTSVATKEPRV